MCGIAGIVSNQSRIDILNRMLEMQHHRGPDHKGIYVDDGYVCLGHNRLAIIDLTAAANQPFVDTDGRFIITFNGEIYNYLELKQLLKHDYVFKTDSDTEVLLALYIKYGKECLDHLNGMFSFAIWDTHKKKLFAARDRFGVKPFYYSHAKEFYFASEIKAIQTTLNRTKPNVTVWANYFCFGSYGQPDETFFEEIKQLAGGHFLELENGILKIEKWYYFEERIQLIKTNQSFEETKRHYFNLLKDSISLRFRADVPIGFNLSGGVDSSTLLMLVNLFEDKKNIQAYTFYTGDDRYDELKWVEQMIGYTNNELHKVKLKVKEVSLLAKKIATIQDEPYGGIPTLAYAKIFERARKNNTIVLLDGQGMDEQWAGYDYYLNKNSNTIQGQSTNSTFKKHCLSEKLLREAKKTIYPQFFEDSLLNTQYRDLFYTKIPRALRFNDRISMAFSTELREPFLDYRLVEYAFAQPEDFKIKDRTQKYLLRSILSSYVDKNIGYAPKRALQTPQREWMGNELKNEVEKSIKKLKNSEYNNWFNFNEIEKEWKSYLHGNNASSFHLWQWLNASMIFNN